MLDLATCFALVSACRPGTRFVFVGDRDQLPPIGPGAVFSDLLRMRSEEVPRTVLTVRGARFVVCLPRCPTSRAARAPAGVGFRFSALLHGSRDPRRRRLRCFRVSFPPSIYTHRRRSGSAKGSRPRRSQRRSAGSSGRRSPGSASTTSTPRRSPVGSSLSRHPSRLCLREFSGRSCGQSIRGRLAAPRAAAAASLNPSVHSLSAFTTPPTPTLRRRAQRAVDRGSGRDGPARRRREGRAGAVAGGCGDPARHAQGAAGGAEAEHERRSGASVCARCALRAVDTGCGCVGWALL